MAWIQSHQEIERHPKTLKLSLLMQWDIDQTIGKLHRFWWWCIDYAPDGNISRHSADMVALCVGLSADKGNKFINSLYEAEFLDKTKNNHFLIHDWLEHAGRYLRDTKYKNAPEKIQEIKDLYLTIVSRKSAENQPKRGRKSAVDKREEKEEIRGDRKTKTSLPENFEISDRVKKWASEKNFDRLEEHLESFKRKCRAKDYKYANWDDAFMEAVRENWAKLPPKIEAASNTKVINGVKYSGGYKVL